MTRAALLAEWGRILEDPTNVRFTTALFDEAFNEAQGYLSLIVPRRYLRNLEIQNKDTTVNTTSRTYAIPIPANSEYLDRPDNLIYLESTLGPDYATLPCIECPPEMMGVTTTNSFFGSSDTHPRYIRHTSQIEFLHFFTVTIYKIVFLFIKKPKDIGTSQDPELSDTLCRVGLRMAVDYARWKDEQITHDNMISLWNTNITALKVSAGEA